MQAVTGTIAMLTGLIVSAAAGMTNRSDTVLPGFCGMLLALVGLTLFTDIGMRSGRSDRVANSALAGCCRVVLLVWHVGSSRRGR